MDGDCMKISIGWSVDAEGRLVLLTNVIVLRVEERR